MRNGQKGVRSCLVGEDPAAAEAWLRAAARGFLRPEPGPEEVRTRLAKEDLSRARGVFDGERCVATYRSFDQKLTTVGGAPIASNAVASVSVTATHRRRGLLSGMIAADLAEARERGAVVSTLVAAEHPIYGRFGFGPVTSFATWRVDAARCGVDPRAAARAVPDGDSLAFVTAAEVREMGPELHERWRRSQPGAIDRPPLWWERATGETVFGKFTEPFHVLYRDAQEVPQGLVSFTIDDTFEIGEQSADSAVIRDLVATTPAAERALWHLVLSLDWVSVVDTGRRAPDALLPDLLPDPRAARIRMRSDFLWLRPLDLPRMLAARAYAAAGELVLDVRDPLGLAGGRVLLETDGPGAGGSTGGGARCGPTRRDADLSLDTGTLAPLYLGDVSAARLAALGALREESAGAVARADLLLHTGRRPFCPDIF